jgi:hypothetical protein
MPGRIVISYETYALVRDMISAHRLPPITLKGISREIIPYLVDGAIDASGRKVEVFREHMNGLDFYLDPSMVDEGRAQHIRTLLQNALKALEKAS